MEYGTPYRIINSELIGKLILKVLPHGLSSFKKWKVALLKIDVSALIFFLDDHRDIHASNYTVQRNYFIFRIFFSVQSNE